MKTINIISKEEVKEMIKEQSDKDRKYVDDLLVKIIIKINDIHKIQGGEYDT